jgi:Protein of unknown function (DUF4230)
VNSSSTPRPDHLADRPARRRPLIGATSLAVVLGFVGIGALLFTLLGGLFGFLRNPFATTKVDRTGPALLTAVKNLARIEGSSGTFQVVVDVEEDAEYLPDALKGQRIIYLAQGSASGTVDLGGLSEQSITIDETTKTATFTVPKAQISNVRIDLTASRVLSYERGLIDRIGDAVGDTDPMPAELTTKAELQLETAAQESELRSRAEANTKQVLTSIGNGLGYTNVIVTFE